MQLKHYRFPDKLHNTLKNYCEKNCRVEAAVVRRAVIDFLRREGAWEDDN